MKRLILVLALVGCGADDRQPCGVGPCASGLTCCSGEQGLCADLTSDPKNCGGCGWTCALPGWTCKSGACKP